MLSRKRKPKVYKKTIRPNKIKKVKAPSRSSLKKKADTIFSLVIRSVGRCRACGALTSLQCAHIISRGYLAIRWSQENAVCLCAHCHLFYTHHPIEWETWVESRFGKKYYSELKTRALQTASLDYPSIIARLNNTTLGDALTLRGE